MLLSLRRTQRLGQMSMRSYTEEGGCLVVSCMFFLSFSSPLSTLSCHVPANNAAAHAEIRPQKRMAIEGSRGRRKGGRYVRQVRAPEDSSRRTAIGGRRSAVGDRCRQDRSGKDQQPPGVQQQKQRQGGGERAEIEGCDTQAHKTNKIKIEPKSSQNRPKDATVPEDDRDTRQINRLRTTEGIKSGIMGAGKEGGSVDARAMAAEDEQWLDRRLRRTVLTEWSFYDVLAAGVRSRTGIYKEWEPCQQGEEEGEAKEGEESGQGEAGAEN